MIPLRDQGGDDAGLTFIELVIYMLIASMVLVAVSAMMINSLRAQENVLSESEATNRGQVVSSAIERAVRNAIALDVVGGTTLLVHTSLGGELTCQGFSLAGFAKMASNNGALPSEWPEWESGLSAIPGEPLLEEAEPGKTVKYAFDISTTGAPVRFIGVASARNPTGVSSPCWT